jgi:hypothetical protein
LGILAAGAGAAAALAALTSAFLFRLQAFLYGEGTAGGLINQLTKQADTAI